MIAYACYEFPLGPIQIGCRDGFVVTIQTASECSFDHSPSYLSDLAAGQLREYFAGKRRSFDFPIRPEGTPFQSAVWQALRNIPYGEIRSYQEIAASIGKPGACRAVGMACHRNPIWIVIPCHRVLGKNCRLTGYAGGLDMKRSLLELEQQNI